MSGSAKLGVCAYFQMAVGKEVDGEDVYRLQTPSFHNLVTDAGLERMGTGGWCNYVAVGTSNTPPSVGDTLLGSIHARVGVPTSYGALAATHTYGGDWIAEPIEPPYIKTVFTVRFNAGTFNNTNLAEVGIGWDGGKVNNVDQVNLWNRELIKDALGNPSTITVLSDEFLDVTVEIRTYIQTHVNETTINVYDSFDAAASPVGTRTVRTRFWRPSSAYINPLGAATDSGSNGCSLYSGADTSFWYIANASPTGGLGNNDSYYGGYWSRLPYVANSRRNRFGGGFPLPRGVGSIKCVIISTNLGTFFMEYDTPIVKTADDKAEYWMELSWDRYTE